MAVKSAGEGRHNNPERDLFGGARGPAIRVAGKIQICRATRFDPAGKEASASRGIRTDLQKSRQARVRKIGKPELVVVVGR